MRLTEANLSKGFGQLAKYRNIVEFRVSSYELNPLAGIISKGLPNVVRRIRWQFFRVVPPLALGYILYEWAEAENARLSRKDPKMFENDK